MKYITNESMMLHETKQEGIVISVTDSELITIEEKEEEILAIIKAFVEPGTIEQGYIRASEENYIDEIEYQDCVEFMLANNMLKKYKEDEESCLTPYQLDKYTRQISSLNSLKGVERDEAEKMQKKICDSTVCLLGAGGIGSYLALALVSFGVEKLILVDFDKIELSNTSRQILYDETDVGKYKVDVAKEKLLKYNSNLHIDTYNVYIQSAEDLLFLKTYDLDLLVLCADTPRGEIQYIADEVAHLNNVPWFCYGPYNHSQIAMGPMIIPGKTKSYAALYPHEVSAFSESVVDINKHFVASICDPYNGFASQFAAIEAFKYLSGVRKPALVNKRFYIDTDLWSGECEEYAE